MQTYGARGAIHSAFPIHDTASSENLEGAISEEDSSLNSWSLSPPSSTDLRRIGGRSSSTEAEQYQMFGYGHPFRSLRQWNPEWEPCPCGWSYPTFSRTKTTSLGTLWSSTASRASASLAPRLVPRFLRGFADPPSPPLNLWRLNTGMAVLSYLIVNSGFGSELLVAAHHVELAYILGSLLKCHSGFFVQTLTRPIQGALIIRHGFLSLEYNTQLSCWKLSWPSGSFKPEPT